MHDLWIVIIMTCLNGNESTSIAQVVTFYVEMNFLSIKGPQRLKHRNVLTWTHTAASREM